MLFAFSFSLCLETTNNKHNTHTHEHSWRLSIAYCLYTTYVLMNIHKRFDILIYVLVRCACTQTCPLEVRAHIAMLYMCCCFGNLTYGVVIWFKYVILKELCGSGVWLPLQSRFWCCWLVALIPDAHMLLGLVPGTTGWRSREDAVDGWCSGCPC